MTPQEAETILADPKSDPALMKQALLLRVQAADYMMLGICADSLVAGSATLGSYLDAFGATMPDLLAEDSEQPGIFVKYNGKTGTCYASAYLGTERGVIVSCYSPDTDGNNATYGGLPLNLFS